MNKGVERMTQGEARYISNSEYVKTGETGPIGRYVCANCIGDTDFYPSIKEKGQCLPECPFCGNTVWKKLDVE